MARLYSWLFIIPLATLVTALFATTAVATATLTPGGRWGRFLYQTWARAVLGIAGARVSVEGSQNLDSAAHYVFASNHASLMDTPVLLLSLPVDFKFLAKQELLRVPFIGWYLRRTGHLTVERGSIRSALRSMHEAARLVRERSLSVLVFPEGTRSASGLQPFKEGAAYLAIESGTGLVPVAIAGTDTLLAAKSSTFRRAAVKVRIGHPIAVQGYTLRDRAELTARLHQAVAAQLDDLRGATGSDGCGPQSRS